MGKKPLKDKNKKNPPTPPTSGNDQHNELEQIPDDIKPKRAVLQIQKADGFAKENINMFLHMQ